MFNRNLPLIWFLFFIRLYNSAPSFSTSMLLRSFFRDIKKKVFLELISKVKICFLGSLDFIKSEINK